MIETKAHYVINRLVTVVTCMSFAFFIPNSVNAKEVAAGIEGGVHPRAQTWVQGKKDHASYTFKGSSWLAYMTHNDPKATKSVSIVFPTIAIWGDSLTSSYSTKDPSGAKAYETINSQGIGAGYIGRYPAVGLATSVLIGLERAALTQTGDTPTSQKYPYGFSSRVGMGYAPFRGVFALDLRVDWVFKHFPSAKSKKDTLKNMQQQSFVPMLGLSLNL